MKTDTIAAIATPSGTGGLGIIRVSGQQVPEIARRILGELPSPRYAHFGRFLDPEGKTADSGLALYFPAPNSFTGEHVLELQGHGGRWVLQRVLETVLALGARMARPGEFSERAFLNDKIDLVQAEAIADLIESGSDAAARAAQRSLQGVFSRQVHQLQKELTDLRVFVEAAIDFPEEEIDFLAESDVLDRVDNVLASVKRLLDEARKGRLLRDGLVMTIMGRPNAGKSSLLNALSGEDTAIVTEIPGTTRDVLREHIQIEGIPVQIADTAGIRETEDQIEAEGVRRARKALQSADIVLWMRDATQQYDSELNLNELPAGAHLIRVANKVDLLNDAVSSVGEKDEIVMSALTGEGLDGLKARILEAVGASELAEGSFSARQRHIEALERAEQHVDQGLQVMRTGAGELLAEELRLSQQALGEITGEMLPDDLLGEIFSSFCIGK